MSPRGEAADAIARGFPRVSGDEPTTAHKMNLNMPFSPRERG